MGDSRVILKGLDADRVRQQLNVLETFSREVMPDDSFEATRLAEAIALYRQFARQLDRPLYMVSS